MELKPDLTLPPKLCHYASTIQHRNGLLRVFVPSAKWKLTFLQGPHEAVQYQPAGIHTPANESSLSQKKVKYEYHAYFGTDSLSLAASLALVSGATYHIQRMNKSPKFWTC
eukprot:s3000_g16.t1